MVETPIQSSQGTRTILALWDSLTAGLWLSPKDNYPSQLEAKLKEKGYQYTIQNAGVSGDTSSELLARTDWILQGGTPDLVILEIGGNDAFQWISPQELEKNTRAVLQKIVAKKIPILFTGMKSPPNLWITYTTEFESVFVDLAKEFNVPFMPFFLEGVAADPKLNQADRIHPTKEWYAIIVDHLVNALESNHLIQK